MLKAAIEKEVSDYVNGAKPTSLIRMGDSLSFATDSLPERVILTGNRSGHCPATSRDGKNDTPIRVPVVHQAAMLRVFDSPHSIEFWPVSVYPLGLNTTIRNRLEQSRHEYGQDGSGEAQHSELRLSGRDVAGGG